MGKDWSLGELLLFKKHGEWESTRVLGVDFFNFDSAIRKEIVESVIFIATVIGSIFPKNAEAEDLSVVVQETLKSLVWSTTLKSDLDVFFHLGLIWWSLFHVNHSSSVSEEVFWVFLASVQFNSLVGEESSSEIITVNKSEISGVDVEGDAVVEISPGEISLTRAFIGSIKIWVFSVVILEVWELMSLEENTLWDTRVLNSWLENMNGIVIKIVVQNTFSDSEVFVTILNNWLLEITVESQNLQIKKLRG